MRQDLAPALGELTEAETSVDTNGSRGRHTVSTRAVIRQQKKKQSTNLCDASREPQCPAPQVLGECDLGVPFLLPPPPGVRQAFSCISFSCSQPRSGEHHLSEGLRGSDNKCLLSESCSWQPAAPGYFLSNHPSWKHRLMPASAKPCAHLQPRFRRPHSQSIPIVSPAAQGPSTQDGAQSLPDSFEL